VYGRKEMDRSLRSSARRPVRTGGVAPASILKELLGASRRPSAALRRFAVLTRPARPL
jgi:hypothetical protein